MASKEDKFIPEDMRYSKIESQVRQKSTFFCQYVKVGNKKGLRSLNIMLACNKQNNAIIGLNQSTRFEAYMEQKQLNAFVNKSINSMKLTDNLYTTPHRLASNV